MGNQTSVEEEEEDIIIKCRLEEMVKQFFEDYIIVWHDPNVESEENKQYIGKLERFCVVKKFTEWEKASLEIQQAKAYCHVITSGANGELLVKEISQSQKVLAIYIFCGNKEYHSKWAKNYHKVSCVETRMRNILPQIQQNLLKWSKQASSLKLNLPVFAPIFNDWDKSGMNNLHRYLKVIPNFKNRLQAKKDFLELSKAIYSKEKDKKKIALFEKEYNEYNKKEALNWYTQQSFVYRITNKCLRIATSDSIQYCRLLLKDIEQAIKEQYQEESKHFHGLLYRGAHISEDEWSSLKNNVNGEIEMHGFLSVSKDKTVALSFLKNPSKMVFITIFVPKCPQEAEQGFAEVEEFSMFPQEKEILFNVRSRFTVLETEDEYSQDMPCRHLVLLYGAQGLRKFVAEENPVEEILIPSLANISCSICQAKPPLSHMLFKPIALEKVQSFFCKKCLTSDIVKAQDVPFLCIPVTGKEKQIKLKGVLMKCTMKVPMYGYECKKCRAKKQKLYFQCTECRREVYCENCVDCLSDCMHKCHSVILESCPFSFWCEKMPEKELDHLKFQNEIVQRSDPFLQGEMFVESHEYQKAVEFYSINIEKNKEKKKDGNLAVAYKELASTYARQGEYKRALEHYSQALEIFQSFYGDHHPEVAASLSNMGNVYYNQAEYKKALEHYSQALEVDRSFYGNNHPEVAASLSNVGNVYESQAEYKKALEHHYQALEIRKSFYGSNHPEVAISHNNLGNVSCRQAEYEKALEHYSQALEIEKSFYGNNDPCVAICYSNMGSVYQDQAEYGKALEHFSQALEIYFSFYGNSHPEIAVCYNNIGNVYNRQAEYKRALEHYSKALEIEKSFYGNNHPDVATSLGNIGNIYQDQAEYGKALEHYCQALEIFKSFYGDNHPEVANSLSNMGNIYDRQAEYKKALEYYSKALEIRRSFYGDNHPDIANSLINMGNVYETQAEYEKALEHYSKALEMKRSFYGDSHPGLANSLIGLGETHFALKEHQKALKYYFKALEMKKSILHEHHPALANIYCHIGHAYNKLEEQSNAREYHLKSLEIKKQIFQDDHPDIAESYSGLGRVHLSLRGHEKALEYHFKSLEIRKSVFHGHWHPDVAECHYDIANVLKSQGDRKEALEYFSKSWEIRKLVFGDDYPGTITVFNEIQALFKELENEKKSDK